MKTVQQCVDCAKSVPLVLGMTEVVFCVFKFVTGIFCNSLGLVADAVSSAADVLCAIGVSFTMHISKKPPDHGHPYGHGKIEFIFGACNGAAMIVGAMALFAFALYRLSNSSCIVRIHYMAVVASLVSIVCSEIMYRFLRCPAAKTNSVVIESIASECRTDVFASIPVLIGVLGAQFGFVALDSLAAVVVAILIGRNGLITTARSIHKIMDAALDSKTTIRMEDLVLGVAGVKTIEHLKSRSTGCEYHVDMQIVVDAGMSVERSTTIAEQVRSILRQHIDHLGEIAVNCRADTEWQGMKRSG